MTALDLPEMLPETRRAVKEHALERRYRFVAGDALTGDLGGPYDLVLVADFCHLSGSETNLRLLRRVRQALAPGGRVAIIGVVGAGTAVPAPQLAFYELGLLLGTADGVAHPFSAYVDWLTQLGYRDIDRVDLGRSTGRTLVRATRD